MDAVHDGRAQGEFREKADKLAAVTFAGGAMVAVKTSAKPAPATESESELSPTHAPDEVIVGKKFTDDSSEESPSAHSDARAVRKFVVEIDKGGLILGVALDVKVRALQIMRLGKGAISAWNESAGGDAKIRKGDYIVEVNGITDVENLVEALRASYLLTLTVVRPAVRTVEITKAGRMLGCDLVFQESQSLTVDVTDIREGAIADYNETVPEEQHILEGDIICSVNGCISTCTRIVEEIQKNDRLVISICRF